MGKSIPQGGPPGKNGMTRGKSGPACTFCGQPITGESPGQANPCEYCSSVSGGYLHSVILTEAIAGVAAGYVEGATYPQILLSMTRFLLDRNDDKLCGIATILAHVACEVAVERSLSDSFALKGIQSLEESVADVLNGYDLADDQVRHLYASLTGDEIQAQPFWGDFIRSAKRRDNIIRKGAIVGRADAEESFKAANDFLEHIAR